MALTLCQSGRTARLRCADPATAWAYRSPALTTGQVTSKAGVPCPVVWSALFGDAPSSLSHLRGRARSYSGRYKADLDRRLAMLAAAGIPHRREARGRRTVLLLGTGYQLCPVPTGLEAVLCWDMWAHRTVKVATDSSKPCPVAPHNAT